MRNAFEIVGLVQASMTEEQQRLCLRAGYVAELDLKANGMTGLELQKQKLLAIANCIVDGLAYGNWPENK